MPYEITAERNTRAAIVAKDILAHAQSNRTLSFNLGWVQKWMEEHHDMVSHGGITRRLDFHAEEFGYRRTDASHPTWEPTEATRAAWNDEMVAQFAPPAPAPAIELRMVQIMADGTETVIAKFILSKEGLQKALDSVLIPVVSRDLTKEEMSHA